jgi:hypothetical protein
LRQLALSSSKSPQVLGHGRVDFLRLRHTPLDSNALQLLLKLL